MVPGFLGILKSRSALAELRSTAGSLEAVLKQYYRLFRVSTRLFKDRLSVFPYALAQL